MTEDQKLKQSHGKSAIERLFFKTNGPGYFNKSESEISNRKFRGIALHQILSQIIQFTDIDAQINSAVFEGLISRTEGTELKKHITQSLEKEIVRNWFDGTGKVLNEADILLMNGKSKRPDRVVVWDNKVHVIDYKSGTDRDKPGHDLQVRQYVDLLKQMKYPVVKGFIWYLDKNEVLEIDK